MISITSLQDSRSVVLCVVVIRQYEFILAPLVRCCHPTGSESGAVKGVEARSHPGYGAVFSGDLAHS